jgi:hypothetical protein
MYLSFWTARHAIVQSAGASANRRDAYSVILFNESPSTTIENDYASHPEAMLGKCLGVTAGGGTNFASALMKAQTVMEANVSDTQKTSVVQKLTPCSGAVRGHQWLYSSAMENARLRTIKSTRYVSGLWHLGESYQWHSCRPIADFTSVKP